MSTNLSSFAYQPGTNGAFQTCVQAIDGAITAYTGWSLASDTGQIDPTTVAKPSAGNDAGFRMYDMATTSLSTWKVKIIYGLDAGGSLRLKVSLGTASNGSGTLSGQTSGTFTWDWLVPPSSPTNLAMSGDSGRLMIFIGAYNGNRSANGFSIHRTVDTAGAMNDDGVEFYYAPSSTAGCQYIPKTGTVPSAETAEWPCIFTKAATGVVGNNLRFGVPVLWDALVNKNPTLAVMTWATNDFSPVTTTTKDLTIYSGTRTYLLDGDTHQLGGNTRRGWRYQ